MNNDNGWESSAEAWIRSVDEGDINRDHLLDPVMLELCGEVAGRAVLDVGCGEGRFCRMLAERGAQTTGIDPIGGMIAAARRRQPAGSFHSCHAEYLPFDDNHFDVTVSYITLLDIDGYHEAIAEMARVTKSGGSIVIANVSSFATASPHMWWRGENNEKLFWTLDHYMTERPEWVEWSGIRVHNWHRPLSAYMKAFLKNGLILEVFDEPTPTEEQVRQAPALSDEGRKPNFYVMRWRKP